MSSGPGLPFGQAYKLAEKLAEELRPTVKNLRAVGSLRRKRPRVGDIEFLAEPELELDLFGGAARPIIAPLKAKLHELGRWVRGQTRQLVVTDVRGIEGFRLEVYLVHPPAQWGSALAIRTGPGELGKYCVTAMRRRGFYHLDMQVRRVGSNELVPTPTEEDFFELAGVDCRPPAQRDAQARGLWAAFGADQRRGGQ